MVILAYVFVWVLVTHNAAIAIMVCGFIQVLVTHGGNP